MRIPCALAFALTLLAGTARAEAPLPIATAASREAQLREAIARDEAAYAASPRPELSCALARQYDALVEAGDPSDRLPARGQTRFIPDAFTF
jgi:hypothetical protein